MRRPNHKVSLMEELLALRDGRCIWCRLGVHHPEYSLCHVKRLERNGQLAVVPVGTDVHAA